MSKRIEPTRVIGASTDVSSTSYQAVDASDPKNWKFINDYILDSSNRNNNALPTIAENEMLALKRVFAKYTVALKKAVRTSQTEVALFAAAGLWAEAYKCCNITLFTNRVLDVILTTCPSWAFIETLFMVTNIQTYRGANDQALNSSDEEPETVELVVPEEVRLEREREKDRKKKERKVNKKDVRLTETYGRDYFFVDDLALPVALADMVRGMCDASTHSAIVLNLYHCAVDDVVTEPLNSWLKKNVSGILDLLFHKIAEHIDMFTFDVDQVLEENEAADSEYMLNYFANKRDITRYKSNIFYKDPLFSIANPIRLMKSKNTFLFFDNHPLFEYEESELENKPKGEVIIEQITTIQRDLLLDIAVAVVKASIISSPDTLFKGIPYNESLILRRFCDQSQNILLILAYYMNKLTNLYDPDTPYALDWQEAFSNKTLKTDARINTNKEFRRAFDSLILLKEDNLTMPEDYPVVDVYQDILEENKIPLLGFDAINEKINEYNNTKKANDLANNLKGTYDDLEVAVIQFKESKAKLQQLQDDKDRAEAILAGANTGVNHEAAQKKLQDIIKDIDVAKTVLAAAEESITQQGTKRQAVYASSDINLPTNIIESSGEENDDDYLLVQHREGWLDREVREEYYDRAREQLEDELDEDDDEYHSSSSQDIDYNRREEDDKKLDKKQVQLRAFELFIEDMTTSITDVQEYLKTEKKPGVILTKQAILKRLIEQRKEVEDLLLKATDPEQYEAEKLAAKNKAASFKRVVAIKATETTEEEEEEGGSSSKTTRVRRPPVTDWHDYDPARITNGAYMQEPINKLIKVWMDTNDKDALSKINDFRKVIMLRIQTLQDETRIASTNLAVLNDKHTPSDDEAVVNAKLRVNTARAKHDTYNTMLMLTNQVLQGAVDVKVEARIVEEEEALRVLDADLAERGTLSDAERRKANADIKRHETMIAHLESQLKRERVSSGSESEKKKASPKKVVKAEPDVVAAVKRTVISLSSSDEESRHAKPAPKKTIISLSSSDEETRRVAKKNNGSPYATYFTVPPTSILDAECWPADPRFFFTKQNIASPMWWMGKEPVGLGPRIVFGPTSETHENFELGVRLKQRSELLDLHMHLENQWMWASYPSLDAKWNERGMAKFIYKGAETSIAVSLKKINYTDFSKLQGVHVLDVLLCIAYKYIVHAHRATMTNIVTIEKGLYSVDDVPFSDISLSPYLLDGRVNVDTINYMNRALRDRWNFVTDWVAKFTEYLVEINNTKMIERALQLQDRSGWKFGRFGL